MPTNDSERYDDQIEYPTFPKWYLLNFVAIAMFIALGGLAAVGAVYDPPTKMIHHGVLLIMVLWGVFTLLTAYLLVREQ